MRNRFMRLIVFFDLPTETAAERKAYRIFRKYLITEGYIMMQESVYSKLLLNQTNVNLSLNKLKKNKPSRGLVQVLKVTEKQYASIENLTGNKVFCEINSEERLVVL